MKRERRKIQNPFTCISFIVTAVTVLAVSTPIALSKIENCGTHGEIWEIAEKDPVEEIQQAFAEKKDFIEDQIESMKDLKGYEPEIKSMTLTKAKKAHSYLVDTTYVLERDIKDVDGNIIYPAGTVYNILDYPPFPLKKKYVVFDGANPDEVDFVIRRYSETRESIVFITSGGMVAWRKAKDRIGSGLKVLSEELGKVLHLNETIAEIYQVGMELRVDVVPPPTTPKDVNRKLTNK